jgi:RNA polymerase sigma-70 factor (ECF subfamily)
MTWRRDETRRLNRYDPVVDLNRTTANTASPADSTGRRELLEKLYGAIHVMPEFDRALVLLSLDGIPYAEIAEVTGLTENHIGVALTRARKRLAELLKGIIDELE